MFSAEYFTEIKAAFDKQMALLDERIRQLEANAGSGDGLSREPAAGQRTGHAASPEAL